MIKEIAGVSRFLWRVRRHQIVAYPANWPPVALVALLTKVNPVLVTIWSIALE
jgi:hypothetical protein